MKVKFSCLKPGDKVWLVYNMNYKEWNCYHPYNKKEILEYATVLTNKRDIIEHCSLDYYSETVYKKEEIFIEIETQFGLIYKRNYDEKFYDDLGKMTITPDIYSNGPCIDIFANKEDAINYIEKTSNDNIERLKSEIKEREEQIKLYEQSIIDVKNLK